jgi:lactoylglutathione lyase
MVKKILHTRMRVNDLERTVQFYTGILGLTEIARHKSPRGSELVFLKAPESEETLEICYYPSSGTAQCQPDLVHVAFEVEDMDKFAAHLKGKGIAFTDGPTSSRSGTFAFIDAPEGYEVELIQRAVKGR